MAIKKNTLALALSSYISVGSFYEAHNTSMYKSARPIPKKNGGHKKNRRKSMKRKKQ